MSHRQESREEITTIRFKLPFDCESIKPAGPNELIAYVKVLDAEAVREQINESGMTIIEKDYYIHVSCPSESIFRDNFGDLEYSVRPEINGNFIAKIDAKTQEKYDEILDMNIDGFRITRFQEKFNTARKSNKEEENDVRNAVRRDYKRDDTRGYSRDHGAGGRGYQRDHGAGGRGYSSGRGSGRGYSSGRGSR